MISTLLAAWFLLAVTVTIHAAGLSAILPRISIQPNQRFRSRMWHLIQIAWALVILHLAEILVWALFYWWQKLLPDAETAFYFSGVTYTTLGYGDVVLPKEWRLLAPVEGMTGILMSGLSTGLFFAVVSRMYGSLVKREPDE